MSPSKPEQRTLAFRRRHRSQALLLRGVRRRGWVCAGDGERASPLSSPVISRVGGGCGVGCGVDCGEWSRDPGAGGDLSSAKRSITERICPILRPKPPCHAPLDSAVQNTLPRETARSTNVKPLPTWHAGKTRICKLGTPVSILQVPEEGGVADHFVGTQR